MADTLVQRGAFIFGADEDTATFTLPTAAPALDRGFAYVTNVRSATHGPSGTGGAARFNSDLGVVCWLSALDTITFKRWATGVDEDVEVWWEAPAYVGPAGGDFEWFARTHGLVTLVDVASGTRDIPDVDDSARLLPWLCGAAQNEDVRAWARANATLKLLFGTGPGGEDQLEVERSHTNGRAMYTVAALELVGGGFEDVRQNLTHEFSGTSAETVDVTDVGDWSRGLIVPTYRGAPTQNALDEVGFTAWPHPTDTAKAKVKLHAGADLPTIPPYTAILHVAVGDWTVQHLDTEDGGETAIGTGNDRTWTIGKVHAPATMLMGSGCSAGGGTAQPRSHASYKLDSIDGDGYTTAATWHRWYSGSDFDEHALQVLSWPTTLEPDPVDSYGDAPAWGLELELRPAPVDGYGDAPAWALELELRPAPVDGYGDTPAWALELELRPAPVDGYGDAPAWTLELELAPAPADGYGDAPAWAFELELAPAPADGYGDVPAWTVTLARQAVDLIACLVRVIEVEARAAAMPDAKIAAAVDAQTELARLIVADPEEALEIEARIRRVLELAAEGCAVVSATSRTAPVEPACAVQTMSLAFRVVKVLEPS